MLAKLVTSLEQMQRKQPSTQLGEVSFLGQGRNCFGTHGISRGIEVDKAKVEVILKLPPPVNVKGVRSFLGHAGFY